MKRSIYMLGISVLFVTPMFMACESVAQKEQKAKDAQIELDQLTQDVADKKRKEQEAAEWNTFRTATKAKIAANDERIIELRARKAKPGKALDGLYAAQIDGLQTRNADLNARLVAYEKEQSNWETFKREFERDMDALGKSFEDFGNNSQK